ncbi:hypothetical protein IW146_001480 [Coemansia sp. RSA 922]|nr:hypothetical protein H4S03_001027 [Coemansia sp. S3946]KAJ2069263.1 hypothetical protein GGI08_000447 [Coemansia sp. S2]KAJ2074530.1 hypothetical protein GGH13_001258 [Coemansia sp. S155-1]KAJ2116511.1 hypothetical protein IW146_001480 [Coemansia sp. RSA 922]
MEPADRSDTTTGQVEQPATPPQDTHALLHGLDSPDVSTADSLLSIAAGARVGPVVRPHATGNNAFPASFGKVPTTTVLTVGSYAASTVVSSATSTNTVLAVAASTASGSTVAPAMDTQATFFRPEGKFSFNLPLIAAANFDAYPASSCRSTYSNTAPVDHGAYHALFSRRIYSNITRPRFRIVSYVHPHATNVNATPANLAASPVVQSHDTHSDAGPAISSATPPSPDHQRANSRESSVSELSSDSESEENVSYAELNSSAIIIRNRAGNVTLGEFTKLFEPFIFISLDMIVAVYLQLVGRKLTNASADLTKLNWQLRSIEGFEIWAHGLNSPIGSFLVRSGPTYQQMSLKIYQRLRIAEEEEAGVVPVPVFYFHLVTIGCVHARQLADSVLTKQLSDVVLPEMFSKVTDRELSSRWVISEVGPMEFPGNEYCRLAQGWLMRICEHIAEGDRMEDLLDIADEYYAMYKKMGRKMGNKGAVFDPDGSIGQRMLNENNYLIKLVLGLHGKDFLKLFKYLPSMADGILDASKQNYLKRASRYAQTRLEQDI